MYAIGIKKKKGMNCTARNNGGMVRVIEPPNGMLVPLMNVKNGLMVIGKMRIMN